MSVVFNGVEYSEELFLNKYIEQKLIENDAKELRVQMEKALLEKYGDRVDDDKTSKQFKVGRYTVKIKRNITYKLTDAGWEMVWKLPENERPIDIKYSHTKGKNFPSLLLEEIENETKPSFEVSYR